MYISVEHELPVVFADTGAPVVYDVFVRLWEELVQAGWSKQTFGVSRIPEIAYDGVICGGQIITTDSGPTIEINPSPVLTIQEVERQVRELRADVVTRLLNQGVGLLGSGVHPLLGTGHEQYYRHRTPRKPYDYAIRERGWRHGSIVHVAANQEVIDVPFDVAIDTLRVMHRLAGLFLFLFRNDPDLSCGGKLSIRPEAWRTHVPSSGRFASDKHKVWLPEQEIRTWTQYLKLLWDTSPMFILGTKNDGLVYIKDHPTFWEFLRSAPEQGWPARSVDDERDLLVTPTASYVSQTDWTYMGLARLRWKWDDAFNDLPALIRAYESGQMQEFIGEHVVKLLIENRSIATQPPSFEMSSLALVVGLMANFERAKEFADSLPYEFWLALAREAEIRPLGCSSGAVSTKQLLLSMLNIAAVGLHDRGYGEGGFLVPLYDRVESGKSPSESMLEGYKDRGLSYFLDQLLYRTCCSV